MALEIFLVRMLKMKPNNSKIYKWNYSNNYNILPGNLFRLPDDCFFYSNNFNLSLGGLT